MSAAELVPRKAVLEALGYARSASRASWSHDDGRRIIFNAWINRFDPRGRHPMSTTQYYERGLQAPKFGHRRWLEHLDLVLAGKREPVLINSVPREPGVRQGTKGAKGWLPRYLEGAVLEDPDGLWFVPSATIPLG